MWTIPFIFRTDGYKLDHRRHYPDRTTRVSSNSTARFSRVPDQEETVWFGAQPMLMELFGRVAQETFFGVKRAKIEADYKRFLDNYMGPDQTIGTDHICELHELGYVPLEFWMLPEGTLVPIKVPYYVTRNTHEDFGWVTNYFETTEQTALWLPTTNATTAYRFRKMLEKWTNRQEVPDVFIQWQGHDFSYRGMANDLAAAFSGAAHLLSFTGTDTLPAILFVEEYYAGDNGLIGGSIPATEHSVMSAGGELGEARTVERLLDLYPTGPIACVADTYDFFRFIDEVVPSFKDRIMSREGKFVPRPDSGDPILIVAGDPEAPEGSLERMGAVEVLWNHFGGTTSPTGHRTLDPHVGLVYGDSINYDRGDAVAAALDAKGFAIDNMAFGMGSYGYQMVTRDTYGIAMKATAAVVDGQERMLFKDPKTDTNKMKKSAKGNIVVERTSDGRLTMTDQLAEEEWLERVTAPTSAFQLAWRDGELLRHDSFADIRARLHPPA